MGISVFYSGEVHKRNYSGYVPLSLLWVYMDGITRIFIYLLTRSILILFRIILYTHALSHPPFRPQCVLIQSQQYLPRFLRYSE